MTALLAISVYQYLNQYNNWLVSVGLSVLVCLALTLILGLVWIGSIIRIRFMRRIVTMLASAPPDATLECEIERARVGVVYAVQLDTLLGKVDRSKLWSSIYIRWPDGYRTVKDVLSISKMRLNVSYACFVIVSLPVFFIALWFGLTSHWSGLIFALCCVVSQWWWLLILPSLISDFLNDLMDVVK